MLNLSSTDPGFYGKAMYVTQQPKYGEYYSEVVKEKNEGNFCLLLCLAVVGRPFAKTKVCYSQFLLLYCVLTFYVTR